VQSLALHNDDACNGVMRYTIPMTIEEKIDEQTKKIDAMYISVEKMRKYFLITLWVTLIAFVLPLIGIAIVLPKFINTFTRSLGGLI